MFKLRKLGSTWRGDSPHTICKDKIKRIMDCWCNQDTIKYSRQYQIRDEQDQIPIGMQPIVLPEQPREEEAEE